MVWGSMCTMHVYLQLQKAAGGGREGGVGGWGGWIAGIAGPWVCYNKYHRPCAIHVPKDHFYMLITLIIATCVYSVFSLTQFNTIKIICDLKITWYKIELFLINTNKHDVYKYDIIFFILKNSFLYEWYWFFFSFDLDTIGHY